MTWSKRIIFQADNINQQRFKAAISKWMPFSEKHWKEDMYHWVTSGFVCWGKPKIAARKWPWRVCGGTMTRNTSSGEPGLVFTRKSNSHLTLGFIKSQMGYSQGDPDMGNSCPGTRERSWSKHCLCPRTQPPCKRPDLTPLLKDLFLAVPFACSRRGAPRRASSHKNSLKGGSRFSRNDYWCTVWLEAFLENLKPFAAFT